MIPFFADQATAQVKVGLIKTLSDMLSAEAPQERLVATLTEEKKRLDLADDEVATLVRLWVCVCVCAYSARGSRLFCNPETLTTRP